MSVFEISKRSLSSFMSTGNMDTATAAAVKPLQELLKFLSENGQNIVKESQALTDFEELTATTILQYDDPILLKILKDCGWTGYRYLESDDIPLDVDYLKQSLSNYYLKAFHARGKFASQRSFGAPTTVSTANNNHSKNKNKNTLADHILPLCPDMLIQAMELDVLASSQPACIYFYGACVLADMSGFSKFSGEMCSKGVEGLDELRATTSGFLGDLVDTVYKYKGDVIAFAGDALICVFPGCKPYLGSRSSEPGDFTPECALRALLCACELSNYKNKNLSTHVGVSFGEMNLAMLGGYNKQWVYVLAGDCVSELSLCVPDAGPQEVCCTQRCLKVMESTEEVAQNRINTKVKVFTESGNVKIKIEVASSSSSTTAGSFFQSEDHNVKILSMDENEDYGFELVSQDSSGYLKSFFMKNMGYRRYIHDKILKQFNDANRQQNQLVVSGQHQHSGTSMASSNSNTSIQQQNQYYQRLIKMLSLFIPDTVQHALHSDTNMDIMGELRNVTTMFLSLDSYDKEKEGKDPLLLQRFLNFAQRRLVESGGFLRQFLVDDKGCVLIAMWGVPAFTYANNCTRGLYCAASIALDALQEDFKVSIGVATGMVFCGCVGATSRYDYVGIGTDVNIAARLMCKAHGAVYIDPTTYRSLNKSSKNLLVELDPIVLKGLKEPMKPYKYDVQVQQVLPQLNEPDERLGSNLLIRKTVAEALSRHLDQICHVRHRRSEQDEDDDLDGTSSGLTSKKKSEVSKRSRKKRGSFDLGEKGENNGNSTMLDLSATGVAVGVGSDDTDDSNPCDQSHRDSLTFSRSASNDDHQLLCEDVEDDVTHNTNMNSSVSGSHHRHHKQVSSVMFLLGAAGAGKSAACKYFRQSAHQRNIPCIMIQAHSSHRGVPYGVVRDLFFSLIGRHTYMTGNKFGRKTIFSLVENSFREVFSKKNSNLDGEGDATALDAAITHAAVKIGKKKKKLVKPVAALTLPSSSDVSRNNSMTESCVDECCTNSMASGSHGENESKSEKAETLEDDDVDEDEDQMLDVHMAFHRKKLEDDQIKIYCGHLERILGLKWVETVDDDMLVGVPSEDPSQRPPQGLYPQQHGKGGVKNMQSSSSSTNSMSEIANFPSAPSNRRRKRSIDHTSYGMVRQPTPSDSVITADDNHDSIGHPPAPLPEPLLISALPQPAPIGNNTPSVNNEENGRTSEPLSILTKQESQMSTASSSSGVNTTLLNRSPMSPFGEYANYYNPANLFHHFYRGNHTNKNTSAQSPTTEPSSSKKSSSLLFGSTGSGRFSGLLSSKSKSVQFVEHTTVTASAMITNPNSSSLTSGSEYDQFFMKVDSEGSDVTKSSSSGEAAAAGTLNPTENEQLGIGDGNNGIMGIAMTAGFNNSYGGSESEKLNGDCAVDEGDVELDEDEECIRRHLHERDSFEMEEEPSPVKSISPLLNSNGSNPIPRSSGVSPPKFPPSPRTPVAPLPKKPSRQVMKGGSYYHVSFNLSFGASSSDKVPEPVRVHSSGSSGSNGSALRGQLEREASSRSFDDVPDNNQNSPVSSKAENDAIAMESESKRRGSNTNNNSGNARGGMSLFRTSPTTAPHELASNATSPPLPGPTKTVGWKSPSPVQSMEDLNQRSTSSELRGLGIVSENSANQPSNRSSPLTTSPGSSRPVSASGKQAQQLEKADSGSRPRRGSKSPQVKQKSLAINIFGRKLMNSRSNSNNSKQNQKQLNNSSSSARLKDAKSNFKRAAPGKSSAASSANNSVTDDKPASLASSSVEELLLSSTSDDAMIPKPSSGQDDRNPQAPLKRSETAKRIADRKTEEYVFHQVLKFLLKDSPKAIVIENGHLCDELSWQILQGLVEEPDVDVAILVTILLKGYLAEADKEALPSNNRKVFESSSSGHIGTVSAAVSHRDIVVEDVTHSTHTAEEESGTTSGTIVANTPTNAVVGSTSSDATSAASASSTPSNASAHGRSFFSRNPYEKPPQQTNSTTRPIAPMPTSKSKKWGRASSVASIASASTWNSIHTLESSSSIAIKAKISKKLQPDVAAAGLVVFNQPYSEILELGGLDRDEVKEILKFTLKVDTVSDELADLVVNVSSGNPFWCRNIASFIKDRGIEEFDKVTTGAGKSDPREMLTALIVCRMEKLAPEDQMILRHASIIGQVFTSKLLHAIIPFRLDGSAVLQTLGSLVGQGFLLCLEESPDHKFAFQNPLIQSVIYHVTTPSDAANIHRSIAEYIEVTFCENLRPYYPSLGYHYRHCTDMRDQAFKYEIKSADQAIGQGAYNDGLEFLKSAMESSAHKYELRLLLELIFIAKEDIQTAIKNQSNKRLVAYHFARWNDKNIIEYDKLKKIVEQKIAHKMKFSRSRFFLPHGLNSNSSEDIYAGSSVLGFGGASHSGRPAELTWQPSYVFQKRQSMERRREEREQQLRSGQSGHLYQGYVIKKLRERRERKRSKSHDTSGRPSIGDDENNEDDESHVNAEDDIESDGEEGDDPNYGTEIGCCFIS